MRHGRAWRTPMQGAARRMLAAAAVCAMAAVIVSCAATASPTPTPDTVTARPPAPAGELPDALTANLQAALQETMSDYGVPGAAMGVWVPGEGSWTMTVGTADIAGELPVSDHMSWPVRSVTKTYTVTLLLQLVDEGRVSLDDPIAAYLDDVTDGEQITLRDLAAMRSGNADYTDEDFYAALAADPDRVFTLDDLNGFALDRPAQFPPDAEGVYTNSNTNFLGAVVEDVTGEDFSAALRDRLLDPLGLHATRYVLDVDTWTDPHPVGYAPGAAGLEPQSDNMSIFGPAGSMVTTLDDARVWGGLLASGALVQPDTQLERLQAAPLDSGPPYDVYGLGIGGTDGWWGHNGEGLGFTAAVFSEPDTGATIAVFMNLSDLPDGTHPADLTFRKAAAILRADG